MENEPALLRQLKKKDELLYHSAKQVRADVTPVLRRISDTFPHYTCHDDSHSDMLVEIAGWLIGEVALNRLNGPELYALYCSFYLHDVGMAVTPDERASVAASEQFKRFHSANHDLDEVEALAEWIRKDHHERSARIVRESSRTRQPFVLQNGLAEPIALLCESHGRGDISDFERYDPFTAWGAKGQTLCIPLLAVYLRLADVLHLTNDRTPLAAVPFVNLRNAISRREWSKHLSTVGIAPVSPQGLVRLTCVCSSVDVHRELIRFCDYVNEQFRLSRQAIDLLNAHSIHAELAFKTIEPRIRAEGYEPWLDLTFQLEKDGILELLRGSNLYPGAGAALNELLINAIDATRQARHVGLCVNPIEVRFDKTGKSLSVADSGTGMDEYDVKHFLLHLGRSLYRSKEYADRYRGSQRIDPISQFGIGFASCFLAAERVTVETKKDGSPSVFLDMYDLASFVAARKGDRLDRGTHVMLRLRADAIDAVDGAVCNIGQQFPHVEFPIEVTNGPEQQVVYAKPSKPVVRNLLTDFFRARPSDVEIPLHAFSPERDGVDGCIGLVCRRKDGVLFPGSPPRYQFRDFGRTISQLGYRLPLTQHGPEFLLGKMQHIALVYDIDLRGERKLELDPARARVQPSASNQDKLRWLDERLIDLLIRLDNTEWKSLDRGERDKVYDVIGKTWLDPLLQLLFFHTLYLAPLVDLVLDRVPFVTRSRAHGPGMRTWNEIRELGAPIASCYRYNVKSVDESEKEIEEIADLLPNGIVIDANPSYRWTDQMEPYSDQTAVVISERSRQIYPVSTPWRGTAEELARRSWDTNRNRFSFVVPFVNGSQYAVVSNYRTRRPTALAAWVNRQHPKMNAMISAAIQLELGGKDPVHCKKFLYFLHELQGGVRIEQDYVDYLVERQEPALAELESAGSISGQQRAGLRLSANDLVPWEWDP